MKNRAKPSRLEGRTNLVFSGPKPTAISTILTGRFFISAGISALIGLTLYNPLPNGTGYWYQGAAYWYPILVGMAAELFLALADCVAVLLLYPYTRVSVEKLALSYFCFRIVDTVSIGLGTVCLVFLLSLGHSYLMAEPAENRLFDVISTRTNALAAWSFIPEPASMIRPDILR